MLDKRCCSAYNLIRQRRLLWHRRSRYYQGMIDLNLIEKGEPYQKLNRSYVIFICTFDLFGKGYYRYSFENICKEDTDISLEDMAYKIFFNTAGTTGEIPDETKAFLKYMGGTPNEDAYVKKLQDRVKKARENEEWRREYMTLLMRDRENIEKGKAEGRTEEKIRTVKLLLQMGKNSVEEISVISELPVLEVMEIKKSL